ncbi:sugar ABC transporter ATP-binding protein [Microbispora corallina]|uniref:Sugar ABC transporter ATP-binding protein n=1 Tax=Microbispora corallina TaxID=83302 RepID=A0ABQ4FRE4_9ACTN|nr:sugar ABC transporter ATP-binding protein [Microbispora corallina]GIH37337.1 sugar ABC transporter ATP-binding protein [Microbispora corallina]
MIQAEPVVSVSGLAKRYGATWALRDVTVEIRPGEVVGLIGTNGAGKSTLIRVLSGATRPTAGTVRLGGREFRPGAPLDAIAAGVQTVHQNIDDGIVFGTTVADNLTLDVLARGGSGWFTTRARTRARAREIAAAVGLDAPLDAPVEALPASERQRIVIARAVARRPRLLILDEPTSTLSFVEAGVLLETVRDMAASGVAVLYVSHRLAEVEDVCHRVVVLRDGEVRRTLPAPVDRAAVVEAMLGDLAATPRAAGPREAPEGPAVPVLRATGIRTRPGARPFDLEVRPGEILGVVGLVGSGKTELLEQLYGLRPATGDLRLDGRPYRPRDPHDAVRAGVAFAAEERSAQAIVPGWSVRAHVTLPRLAAHSRAGLLRRRSEQDSAAAVMRRFGVRASGPDAPIGTLSGGNQQKVVVGRWLEAVPRLLLLDEPFRGVDVGARADIGRTLAGHAAGMGVVVASSDPQEVLDLAGRILVLHDGDPAGEIDAAGATTARLAALMSGRAA